RSIGLVRGVHSRCAEDGGRVPNQGRGRCPSRGNYSCASPSCASARNGAGWCNGARLVDDLAYVGAQVQLNVAALLEALLERLFDDGGRGRAGDGLREGVHLGGQRVVGGKRRRVDEALDVGQREQVETGDPLGKGIDELDELRVGNGAVDVP